MKCRAIQLLYMFKYLVVHFRGKIGVEIGAIGAMGSFYLTWRVFMFITLFW